MELKSEDGLIRWMDGSSNELASARITRFDMVPVRVPRRRMYYYCLKAYKVLGADGVSVHDVEREWLASDVRPYVEISRSGRPVSEADTGFWECSE